MDNLVRLQKNLQKPFFLIYSSIVLIRCIVIGILFYRYIIFSSSKEVKKGGTLVEAIYNPISYLPYRGDQKNNLHYQTLLFHGCKGGIFDGMCTIRTTDDQTYLISLQNGVRSDQTPVKLEDVYFTYKTIVIDNIRQQPYLTEFADIAITSIGSGLLEVTFPFADQNNINFFTLPILPKHKIEGKTVEEYVELFSSNPITSTCATLGKSNNAKNLVIDMTRCPESNINYYQLKSFNSYEEMIDTGKKSEKTGISFYKGQEGLPGYSPIRTMEDTYTTMFFNTSSVRLSPRIQRALGGLIYNGLSKESLSGGYFSLYTGLLSRHKSDGTNVIEYITSKNPLLDYDKQGLEKAGVKKLPENFTVEGSNVRQAYYIEGSNDTKIYNIILNTTEQFSNTKARSNTSKVELSIKTTNDYRTHALSFTLGADKNGIRDGVNTVTIQGTQQGKLKTIAVIDIYYLGNKDLTKTQKLKIIYYKDPISLYTIDLFKKIIEKNNLQDSFEIKGYNDLTSFGDAINGKIYDIMITSLSMNTSADIAAIITNEDTQKNPSSYKNIELAKKLEDYSSKPSSDLKVSIQETFSTDMPFVILGQNRSQYWLKDTITFNYTGQLNKTSIRQALLLHSNIVSHLNFRGGKIIEKENFKAFIESEQKRK